MYSRSEWTAFTLRLQVNLDGYALPIKKLKGTEPVESLDLSGKNLHVASAIVIASLISVNGLLTALDLSDNYLKDEGVSAVCKAIQSNKETKLASLNFGVNKIGPVGANALVAMVAVTGSLTSLNLSSNHFGAKGAATLAPALAANGSLTSIDLSENALTNYGRDMTGIKQLAAALGVNGSLTSIDLSSNQLCGLNWKGKGKYTTVGITAIADALRVNGALTKMRYVSPRANLGPHI